MGHYNNFAGGSVERIAALSDGVFAIAMTLLVLDLKAPAVTAIHSELGLAVALQALLPRLLLYAISFMTLGIFWIGQQTQLNLLARSDRDLTWLHLAFLAAAGLTPFTTALMGEFIDYRLALIIYWANILLLGLLLLAAWRYAARRGMTAPAATAEASRAIERRIIISQGFYAIGAVLCVFSTLWSLGFILLMQLNYVIAPRLTDRY
jgi:uncharacterized membrane protein